MVSVVFLFPSPEQKGIRRKDAGSMRAHPLRFCLPRRGKGEILVFITADPNPAPFPVLGNRVADWRNILAKQTHPGTRRTFMLEAAAILPALAVAEKSLAAGKEAEARQPAKRPLKVVCVGAHPDDPESGCGGTLAR